MNKKINDLQAIFFGLLFIINGCTEDYLEQKPDNRMELNSLDKAAKTLVCAYPRYSYAFTEWMSDNVTYIPEGEEKAFFIRQLYEWKEAKSLYQDTPTGYWNKSYYAIAQANLALSAINNKVQENDSPYRNSIIAEALLCRAYAHFMLVNLFAKPYDKNTAKDDLGIPYVKQVEKKLLAEYKRNTVQEVYDLAEQDLLKGLELVSSQYYKHSGKFHFTKESALAFASRFYLWKKDYEQAEKYASELLSKGTGEAQWVRDYGKEVWMVGDVETASIQYSKPSFPYNLLLATCAGLYSGSNLFSSGYACNGDVLNEIYPYGISSDWRALSAEQFTGAYWIPRNRYFYNHIGYFTITEVLFSGEEVVFNRAEARLLKKNPDIAGAESDLKLILGKGRYKLTRGVLYSPEQILMILSYSKDTSLSKKDILLEIIIDERRREFLSEGMRWFDIRRFHLPVTHKLRDGTTDTLTENDPRKVLPIPDTAVKFGLKPNSTKS